MADKTKALTIKLDTEDVEKKLDSLIEKANKLKLLITEIKELSNSLSIS